MQTSHDIAGDLVCLGDVPLHPLLCEIVNDCNHDAEEMTKVDLPLRCSTTRPPKEK